MVKINTKYVCLFYGEPLGVEKNTGFTEEKSGIFYELNDDIFRWEKERYACESGRSKKI